jgi:hypothetical protein
MNSAELLSKWKGKPSKKGTGFAHLLVAQEHWHIAVSCLNIGGTLYYQSSILDGFSRCAASNHRNCRRRRPDSLCQKSKSTSCPHRSSIDTLQDRDRQGAVSAKGC